jgi:hypothetical protein
MFRDTITSEAASKLVLEVIVTTDTSLITDYLLLFGRFVEWQDVSTDASHVRGWLGSFRAPGQHIFFSMP